MGKHLLIMIGLWCAVVTIAAHADTKEIPPDTDQCLVSKIHFDLTDLDRNGRTGHYPEKVSLDYEFCVPYTPKHFSDIQAIDPEIECYHGPSGRIGCGDDEYLCIGHTGSSHYKDTLCRLSLLDYINTIERTWWE